MRRMLTALAFLMLLAVPALAQTAGERTLVMPFENVRRDPSIFWLGEASAVLLGDALTALGTNAITRAERLDAFERLQVPPAAALTDATVIRLGQLVGASQLIVGSLELESGALVVHARSIALETGRVEANLTERGPISDLFVIFDRVARRMMSPGAPPPSTPIAEYPPVAAFENYIKGLIAEMPATAVNYLRAALSGYPGYDRARLALWDVYSDMGAFDQAIAAVQGVPITSPFSNRARFLTGLAQINAKQMDAAFAVFTALLNERADAAVANNLGVIQMRRPATPQTGVPAYYFDRAVQIDPDDPDYYFNLGYAYWEQRDAQAAIYWLREALRRNPADGEAHYILGTALAASGNATESAREKELARRLSSTFEQWDRRPAPDSVPKGLERLKNDFGAMRAQRIEARLQSAGQRDQQQLAAFYLDRGRRLFEQDNDRDAMAELDRALFLSPYLAEAHLLAGRIHLRNGRTREAIDALKISIWSQESADAHAVLGEAYVQGNDVPAARAELQRAQMLDSMSPSVKRLADMLKSF